MLFCRDDRQIAIRSADFQQTGQTQVGLLCGQGVPVAVIPVQTVRHVGWHRVVVGVAHSGGDVEQHIVRIPVRAHVQPVGVQIQRRRSQGRWVDRDIAAGRGEGRIVEILDRQVLQIIVVVDDQPFAGFDVQGRRRVIVVALGRAVRVVPVMIW